MKKTLWFCLAPILIMNIFMACSEGEKEPTGNTSKSAQDGISDSQYCGSFDVYYYDSIVELYRGLRDFDPSELEAISFMENQYMDDTREKTHISEDEERNGIFGSMVNMLLTEKTIMVPYYRGKELPYENREGFANIAVVAARAFRKPCIVYAGLIDSIGVSFTLTYYDRALADEANQKGASWLMAQIDPNGTNVYNYEEIYAGTKFNPIVYEKEYQLGDRDVLAMVIDHTKDGLGIVIYFVYDDIIVCTNGSPEVMDSILPDITFREVSLPTNTPLRDEPGREGTIYSTKK